MVDTGSRLPTSHPCPPPHECPKVPMSTERGVTQELYCSNQEQQMLVMSSPATTVVALQTPTPNWYFLPAFCPIQNYPS